MRIGPGKVTGVLMLLLAAVLGAASTASGQGQAGTTLTVSKTATGIWTHTYSWTIEKAVDPKEQTVCVDTEAIVHYTITATKGDWTEEGPLVAGTITVWNGPNGDRPTEGLKIVDQAEYKLPGSGQFQPLPGATVTIIPSEQLAPGETKTYDYSIPFTPVPGATYRNRVKVTITNHSGHLGEEYGPQPTAGFTMPAGPVPVNDQVLVADDESLPSGLVLTGTTGPDWPQLISDSKTFQFTQTFMSGSAKTYVVGDVATLKGLDGDVLTKATATAKIVVVVEDCGLTDPICGDKFYDTNLNGLWDEDEPPIKGWKVHLQGPDVDTYTFTNSQGRFCFSSLPPGDYTVTEVFPYCPQWVATTDTSFECEVGSEESCCAPVFGNVCVLPASGAHTIRFWSSEKGQRLITPEDLEQLGFSTAAELAEYLRTANLKEFTHMLTAQLIATKLNIGHGLLSEDTILYLGPLGFKSISELVTEAVSALDDAKPQKDQECSARLLTGLNDNKWPFLSLVPCPVFYAD